MVGNLGEASDDELWDSLGEAQGYQRADALLELAARASARDEHDRATTLLAEAQATARELGDRVLESLAIYEQGGAAFRSGDFGQAAQYAAAAAAGFADEGRGREAAAALLRQAEALRALGDHAGCLDAAQQAQTLAAAEGDLEVTGDAALQSARALYLLDREREALGVYETARDSYRSLGRPDRVAAADDFALTVCLYVKQLDRALELARGCLVLANATATKEDDPYARLRLAETHLRREEPAEALRHAELARELYRDVDDLLGVARCERMRGEALLQLERPSDAIEALTDARVLFDAHGWDWEALTCDLRRADVHFVEGQYRRAAAIRRQAIVGFAKLVGAEFDTRLAVLGLVEDLVRGGQFEECVSAVAEYESVFDDDAALDEYLYREFLGFKAVALEAMGDAELATALAEDVIAATPAREASISTALCYEIRGRSRLRHDEAAAAQDLANAIALHLAKGDVHRAEALSKHFLPVDPPHLPKQSEHDPLR